MWDKKNLLDIQSLSRKDIEDIFKLTKTFETCSGIYNNGTQRKKINICQGDMMTVWFEPGKETSTRTYGSFQAAMSYLGGNWKDFDELRSSMAKGETLEDTSRILGGHSQLIVDRHRDPDHVRIVSEHSPCPVINAGNGSEQHPTQTLLDLYTILKKHNRIDDIVITLVGDLKYGRTTHSLIKGLSKFNNITVIGLHPKSLELPEKFKTDFYEGRSIDIKNNLNSELKEIKPDIVYATRIQKERLPEDADHNQYTYLIDEKTMENLPENSLLMHPLPRIGEIKPGLEKTDKRAVFFEQADNGVPVRMAIITTLLGYENQVRALSET